MTGFLALVLVLQAFIPSFAYALEEKPKDNKLITKKLESPDSNFITIGKLKGVGFSKDNPTASISVEEVEQKNNHKKEALGGLEIGDEIVPQALRSTKSPYIQGQQPADPDKPKYWANVQGTLTTVGIDGGSFDWNKVLGQGAKVKLLFTQTNGNVMTGVRFYLEVDKDGTYTWHGSDGKPTYLPLYDVDGNPYTYNVQIQRNFSENVQLIIQESNGTPGVSWRPEGDKQVATISFLNIEIQQVASTKFVSEWHTALEEAARPQIEGYFKVDDETDNNFNFPKNDTTRTILRYSFLENFVEDEDNGPWAFISSELETTPEKVEVKTDTAGLTFGEVDGVKTVKSGDHKFKYEFTYDVINGGKLTMTEVIPITFDANGGKFASITDPNAEQKIVKEVDYEDNLTEKAEDPTREGKTFKGWSTTADGKTPATDADFKNITEKKTFYAIWENNDIKAEELTVSESFKDGTEYVNDFIPTLDTLKGQVEIKDANGVYQELKDGDSLQILDDSGNLIADDDLKDKLYEKLKEDPATEVSRNVTLKGKVNFADGTSQEIDIPIKVIKNIYEGTSTGGKPSYVPDDYVIVTVDPTDKATNPQKTYYYVNPAAKVPIPGENPVGKDDNIFTKWTMKVDSASGDGADYNLPARHQFGEASTITAQYEKEKQGIIKIKYVDENGGVIPEDKRIGGGEYLREKQGKLNSLVNKDEAKEFISIAPKFEGYVFDRFYYHPKGSTYTEDGRNTVTYYYYKKVTTKDKSNDSRHYFKVVFDANGGEFGTEPTDKKDVYIYSNPRGIEKDVQVSFGEVRLEVEKTYNTPSKEGSTFKEWQDNATEGSKVEDSKVIGKPSDNTIETFYAYYENPSAKVVYLDLDGKPIADEFKIDGVDYPTEKEGTLGETIEKTVYTAETAPNFTGYKFNRIELNPANAKYAMDNKATIKIYYEKVPDVIPANPDGSNPDSVPDDYVRVEFVPTDKGTIDGDKVFFVNPKKEVTIPVNNPKAKATYKFKEWKMGADAEGEKYTPSTPKKFTQDTTITATYEETENIIPYDPSAKDPMPRPEGYVRVTFAADTGLSLTESKAYYVKANAKVKLSEIKLDETKYGYPKYKEETGYKFKEWDKEDLVIESADIVVTAKARSLDDVVPKDNPQGGENDKPAGYITVTFKTTDKAGNIEKIVYLNPTKAVALEGQAPEVNPITGYEFADWDRPIKEKIQYNDNDVITAQFNEIGNVVPGDKPQPAGYVKVIFDKGEHGKLSGTTSYWVKPEVEVTVEAPSVKANTGYKFTKWDKKTTLTANKTDTEIKITAEYEKLEDIIPSTDDEGNKNAKPEGYVTLTFEKGEHGKEITGQTVYYVNPKANPAVKLGNEKIVKPTVSPETGYKFKSWNFADTKEILSDLKVTAQYSSIDDVIPKDKPTGGENEKPKDYITVTFEKGANGELEGNTIFYVNPNKAVVLEDKAPTIKPNTGYTSAGWDISINKAIQYKDGDKITALYNEKDDVIPQEDPNGSDKPAGYLTVTFLDGGHGTLSGKTVYYVKPNKEVTVPAPTVTPATGYKFDKWDKNLTQTFTADNTNITAEYKELGDIIPQEKTDGSDKPKGYVTVKFEAVNGTLSGQTVYYVKPNVDINLTNTADGITKNPKVGYTAEGGTWSPAITKKQFTKDETYTFTFKALANVIPEKNNDGTTNTKPDGYVKVEFIAGVNGKLVGGNKTYYVNPTKDIKVGDLTIPKPQANNGYEFLRWAESIDENEVINGNKKFEAIFVPITKNPDNPNPDNPDRPDDPYYPERPDYPYYPERPYYPLRPEVRYETVIQEKVIKVPVPDHAYVKEVRYMQGFKGDFRPKDGLTRAEAAQILANALVEDGYKYNANFKLPYKDIGEAWYTRAVKIVTEANVFAGYDDGNFKPQDKITRNEWIATLKRFQELGDVSGNHMKLKDGHWAMDEIEAAYKEGWLKIYTDGLATYEGDKFIPREEVAAVSNKAFKRILDKTYIRNNEKNLISYKDVKKDMWSYEDILCASNTFLYKKDLYRAHWIKEDNNEFNINTEGFEIVKAKFQRNPR